MVVTYGGAHVAMALPLHHALQAAGFEPVMLGLTTAVDVLRRHHIACLRVRDFVDVANPAIAHWGEFLCAAHHTEGIGIARDESMAYLGASMAELVEDCGEAQALARYREHGLNALLPARLMARILKEAQVDAVIATDSPRAERAALNAAALLGLPSVCVVSSFPHIGLHYLKRADNGAVMCVLNPRIRDQMVEAGRAPESVVATGNPAFDALARPDNIPRRAQLRGQAQLAQADWTVMWAEQPEPADPELPRRMRAHLADVCARNGWRLLVRLHPSSQAAGGEVMPASALLSPRTETTLDALLKSDAVVTLTSTIGFEALLLDKALVVAAISQFSSFVDYREGDGAWVVDHMNAVEAALQSYHAHDARAQALAGFRRAMPQSGGAAAAIIQALAQQTTITP
jgi:hypothetical protein